jgi:hypothetical protein
LCSSGRQVGQTSRIPKLLTTSAHFAWTGCWQGSMMEGRVNTWPQMQHVAASAYRLKLLADR